MDEGIEAKEGIVVGEDDLGNGPFVGTAVGEHHAVAEEGSYLLQESRVVVVLTSHSVGNKARNSQLLEVVEDGGLATTYAPGEGDKKRFIG